MCRIPPFWRKYFNKMIKKSGKPEVVKLLKSNKEEARDICRNVGDAAFEKFEDSFGDRN